MEIIEILDKIEKIIKTENSELVIEEEKSDKQTPDSKNSAKNIMYLVLHFFLNIIKESSLKTNKIKKVSFGAIFTFLN